MGSVRSLGEFGPLVPDESRLTGSVDADEMLRRVNIEHVALHTPPAADDFDDSLVVQEKTRFMQLPVSGKRSLGRLDKKSDESGLLSGLAAVRTKMRSLETVHQDSSVQVQRLQDAADTYSALLSQKQRISQKRKSHSDRWVQTSMPLQHSVGEVNSLLCEGAGSNFMKQRTKFEGETGSRRSEFSSLERLRHGGSRSEGASDHAQAEFASPVLPGGDTGSVICQPREQNRDVPQMDFSLDASLDVMRPVSVDLSSTGSSVRLSEKQEIRLNAYRSKLIRELSSGSNGGRFTTSTKENGGKETGKTSENPRVSPPFLGGGKEKLQKHQGSLSGQKEDWLRMKEFGTSELGDLRQSAVDYENPRRNGDRGEVDFSALRERLTKLKEDIIERRKVLHQRNELQEHQQIPGDTLNNEGAEQLADNEKISRSEPISPDRKVQKKEVSGKKGRTHHVQFKPPPFVAAKSTSVSYSLNVNLQQLLAVLKGQNPVLHSLCLRLGPMTPINELAKAFRRELAKHIRSAEADLEQQLRYYDEACDKFDSAENDLQVKKLEVERSSLAARIEQTDIAVQRMHQQHAKLSTLLSADVGENAPHSCKLALKSGETFKAPKIRTHIRDHTVSSFSKVVDAGVTETVTHTSPKSHPAEGSLWLRDLRQMQLTLVNNGPEKQ